MKLGKWIYSEEGLVLFSEDVELIEWLIGCLKDFGVGYVYIKEVVIEDIIVFDMLQEEIRCRVLVEIKQQFQSMLGLKIKSWILYFGKVLSGLMNIILEDIGS